MNNSRDQALVRTILEHVEDYPWKMQDIGLLGLWLDDRREHRLHVWDPSACVGELPVHDHPFDFTSTVVVGEMTNTRYEEDADGVEYHRVRYRASVDGAAHRRGWDVHFYEAKKVIALAADVLGPRANEVLQGPRATLGPPWGKDHRTALAATVVAG